MADQRGDAQGGVEAARPPETKRARVEEDPGALPSSCIVQFEAMDGTTLGPQIDMPVGSTPEQLMLLVNELLGQGEERRPYSFFLQEQEVMESLSSSLQASGAGTEEVVRITYQPQAVFRVRPVNRCTDTLQGHTDAVLHVSFSPDGKHLASGGGDCVVRFWDTRTCTPRQTCEGHRSHVLCTAWSPDGERFASGDRSGELRVWDPKTGEPVGRPLRGHRKWITSVSWEPMHRTPAGACERLVSASKDSRIKLWNARTGTCLATISGHTDSVESVKWGGEGLLYSASRDRTIKVWAMEDREHTGKLVRTLSGHGHRVNALALSTENVCRTGPYDHRSRSFSGPQDMRAAAQERYDAFKAAGGDAPELLVSCSDDFTLFLWSPTDSKKPLSRMTGHQQAVAHIAFSPDGRYVASASFDKKVKIWNGRTGAFVATLTGHVASVYQVVWSADSRLLVSGSKDSTLKLWELKSLKKARNTLPGHADEVYALDWSPNGSMVASGSKDRTIKIFRN